MITGQGIIVGFASAFVLLGILKLIKALSKRVALFFSPENLWTGSTVHMGVKQFWDHRFEKGITSFVIVDDERGTFRIKFVAENVFLSIPLRSQGGYIVIRMKAAKFEELYNNKSITGRGFGGKAALRIFSIVNHFEEKGKILRRGVSDPVAKKLLSVQR